MFRFFIILFIVFVVFFLTIGTFFYYWVQKDKTFLPRFVRENVYIKFSPSTKDYIKNNLKPIYKWIYKEASEYNPPGDLLPDNLDEKIKNEIKERVN